MNKIYKVIWSKVKHQYVVVSELAHRDGKRSSAASKSIRTLMAVLAVCGMTAFGLGMQDVYAADRETVTAEDGVAQAKEYQYVAIKTTEVGNKKTYEDKNGTSYTYHSETVGGVKYWVRDGYSIKLKTGDRYPGAAKHVQVVAYKTSADPSVDAGLLKSDQIMIEAAKDEDNHAITTFTGSVLNDVSAGTYVGATNEGGTQTPDDWNYIIQDSDGKYKDVTNATAIDGKKPKFVEAVKQADGTYTVNGEIVGTDNLYVIGEVTTTGGTFWNPTTTKNTHYRLGAFVTSEGKIYDGRVFGLNNEVLMTAKEDDGTYYSYWAADTDDPMSPITNMTMGQFNTALKTIDDNSRMLAGDDIKQVDIAANDNGKNGGTIGLLRRGTYNVDTGKWEGTEYTPGTITVENTGGTGGSGEANDVKIKFSNVDEAGATHSFNVNAGSKVEAVRAEGSDKVSALKINGQEYKLSTGGTIAGNFNTQTGEINITQDGTSVLTGKVHDYNVVNGQFDSQTGKLTLNTKDIYSTATGKVEIDGIASQSYVEQRDKLNVKYDSEDKSSVTLGGRDSKTPVKLTNVADGKNASDAVNFSQLSEVKNAENYVTGGSINPTNGTLTLNRLKDGDVTITGLGDYVSSHDAYATEATLDGNTLTIKRNQGLDALTVDLSDLTSGMSSTDYQVVANPAEGSKGVYSVDADGNLKLTVKDLNDPNAEVKEVSISGIAQKADVDNQFTIVNGKLDGAVMYAKDGDTYNKNLVQLAGDTYNPDTHQGGTTITNVADGKNASDAVNFSQLSKVADAENYVTGGSINPTNGTLTLNRLKDGNVTITGLGDYVSSHDAYATEATLNGNTLTIKRNQGLDALTVDLSDLTSGMSSTDYQIVANPAEGSNGVYSVDKDGNLKLTVKDLNNPNAEAKEVSISGIAQKADVADQFTIVNGKLDGAVMYDKDGDTYNKNLVQLAGNTYNKKTHEGGTTITNVADGKNASDAVNFNQLSEVKGEAEKHTTIEPTGTNITVTQNSAEGEALNYTVDLNPVVTLDGTAGDDKQIVLDGNKGTISAENSDTTGNWFSETKTENTFDFDENGGTFTTTETTSMLDGAVPTGTTKYEATFDGDGATFTKTENVTHTSSTHINGGIVTVQGDELFDLGLANKTVIDGGTITVVGAGVNGGQTKIDGEHITAGNVQVNGEDKATITGLDNTKIDYTGFGGGRAATEAQLDAMRTAISGELKVTASDGIAINDKNEVSVNAGAGLGFSEEANEKDTKELEVKVGSNLEINDDNQVDLRKNVDLGADGSLKVGGVVTLDKTGAAIGSVKVNAETSTVDGLANKEWTKEISDAIANKDTDAMGRAASQGQLYDVAEIANNAYTEAGKHTTMTVNNGMAAPEDGSYTTDGNLQLKQTNTDGQIKYDVKLNDDIVLSGSGESAEEQDNRVTLSGTNGTIMATTNFDDMSATTTINGGNVYVGSSVSVGDTVVMTDKDITGLSNTTWNGQTDDESRAATEGQLKVVSDNVSAGWIATDDNGNEITVNPKDNKLNFSGDRNVTVEANKEDGSIDVSLNDDIVLGGKDGSTSRVQIGGTDGVITVTKDADDMGATTTIAGGDIYAGSSVTVGDTVKLTTEDITGLSNTTWDGTTDDVSRAATEGQLQTVSDKVNGGWTATDDVGNKINVNPTNSTLNFASGKNVTVSAADGEISVSLNDEVKLGDYDNGTGIYLSGASGTISATNSISVGEDLVIDGNKKTVNGLSNKTWSKDSFVSGQAATEDQLDAMADWTETQVNNSGWTASTNGGKKTEAITNGETVDFSNTDGNIKVSQDVTANGTSIKFNLNDDLLLGANADEGAGINLSGTAGEIAIKSANGSTINIGNGVITGLTNTVSNENWETFMNSDLGNNGSRAVTEDDLQLVAQHSVQYKTNDDGTIDYNNIFLSGASYSSDGHTGGTMITNVAYASDSDGSAAVNVDKLHDAISDAKTEVTNADKHLNYDKTYSVDRETNKVNLEVVDNQGNVVGNTTIEDVASATDVGNIGDLNSDIAHDSTGDGNVSIVDAVNNVDNKVGDLNYKHDDGSDLNYVTAGDSVTGAIGDLDAAIKDAATEAGQHSSVSGSDNITVAENGTNGNGGTDYKVSLNDDLTLGGKEGQNGSIAITGSEGTITASGNVSAGSFTTGSIAINQENSGTITGLSNTTWNKDVAEAIAANANGEAGTAATQGQLQQAMNGAVQYDTNKDGSVNKDSITLGGSTYDPETHKGGTTITNVADGKNASDAVNMNQLWQTNQAVINNSNNISMLSNSVNKLDNRIDRVGAGAAALAALHPLDFDPDAKWDFAAGYGNYRGANAVAVGAYYRPNEDVMFSVGGSMGGGENMVNAGVSLKIGAGNSGVTTSRVAMAKEIKAMRDVVAKQDAQIQKLTAMVNALVGVQAEPDTKTMFPDVPENHWAYEAVAAMAKGGLVKGYPDGEFKGDRTMTRYEFAQIIQNAIQKGAEVDARLVQEFKPELEYFHIATVAKDKDGNPTIERVRAN